MEKSLADILRGVLIGRKVKLFAINNSVRNMSLYLTDKNDLKHYKKFVITSESIGTIQSIEVENLDVEGDYYKVVIVDNLGVPVHFSGLNSITSKLELI